VTILVVHGDELLNIRYFVEHHPNDAACCDMLVNHAVNNFFLAQWAPRPKRLVGLFWR
jgi:hypothetical protein